MNKTTSQSKVKVTRPNTRLKAQDISVIVHESGYTDVHIIDRYNEKDVTDFDYRWTLQAVPVETLEVLKNHIQNAINHINSQKK